MLASAARRVQLEEPNATPFHLLATVQMMNPDGSVKGIAKLDELWQGPKRYRQMIKLPGAELVEVDDGTSTWRTGRWEIPGDFFHPVLQPLYLYLRMPQRLTQQPAPDEFASLDCVGTEPLLPGVSPDVPLALTTYCMEKGNHILRLVQQPNGVRISYNTVRPFGKKFVARDIEIAWNGKPRFRIHVDALDVPTDFAVLDASAPIKAQDLQFHRADGFATGELFRGQPSQMVSPIFPKPGGTVTLKGQVDNTGNISGVAVVTTSNPRLNDAAIAAFQQWKFRVSYQNTVTVPEEVEIVFQGTGESPVKAAVATMRP
ncbi:MAG: energy transducer TonB [Terriglobus sp.]